jgi:hypothetical protein
MMFVGKGLLRLGYMAFTVRFELAFANDQAVGNGLLREPPADLRSLLKVQPKATLVISTGGSVEILATQFAAETITFSTAKRPS